MEISFLVFLWVIFSVVQMLDERKKTPAPPSDGSFELPTLANDPTQSAEFHEINLEHLYRQGKTEVKSEPKQTQPEMKSADDSKDFEIDLTPASAMNAIVISEILNKPKALRRR